MHAKSGLCSTLLAIVSGLLVACGDDLMQDEPLEQNGHVLVIGVDGARPDAVLASDTPAIDELVADGAWSFEASTQLDAPTSSGPGWASILTGVEANKHKVMSNFAIANADPTYPTFLQRAQDHGFVTAVATNWTGVITLIEPDAMDWSRTGGDAAVTSDLADTLAAGSTQVHFIQLDDVDHAGHDTGFDPDNPDYVAAIETIDDQVGELVSAIESRESRSEEEWLVILTTDHGGEGTSHGAKDAPNRTVWLVVAGDGVLPGEVSGGSHLDVHGTVMQFLEVPPASDWALDGAVVGLP